MSATRIGTVAFGTAVATGSTVNAVAHASTAVGDLVRVYINTKVSYPPTPPPATTGPAGFSMLTYGRHGTTAANGHWEVWEGLATVAGAQTYTFTLGSANTFTGFCETVRGQAASSPSEVLGTPTSYNAVTSTPTSAGTTTEDAELVTHFLSGAVASGTTAETGVGLVWDGAVSKIADRQGSSGSGLVFSSIATETGPTPGASIAARSITLPNTPTGVGTVSIATKAAPSGPPSNTSTPSATGTAAVGSVLTTTNGTWDQSITSYAYQWQRDGSNISGATASTYTVVSGDAGHTVQCVVSATNANGTTTANSNGIAIPSAPVNTVAPVVTTDGTPATGETITVDTGTWTGTGITYAYQWYRNATLLSGSTSNSYTLTVNDEGQAITCRVTATNGGGAATAVSNTITPAVTAPISDASFTFTLSGGASNTDPSLSIGGARGGTYAGNLSELIGPVLGTVAQAGGVFYRVIYIRNSHTINSAASMKLYIETQFDHAGMTVDVAVPSQGVNTTVPALASGTTAPSGVTWSHASTAGAGLDFGTLGPGDYRGIYVRLTIAAGTTTVTESDAVIAAQGTAT